MIQLKRKVDELSTVRKTVDHLAQEINIERKEISQFKKTVQDHSLEIKKVEDSFSSRITFLEELMQSIDDRKIKVRHLHLCVNSQLLDSFSKQR